MDEEVLSKRERRESARVDRGKERELGEVIKRLRKWGIGLFIFICLLGVGYWIFREASKPLPGETVADMGRDHVTDISKVSYNSNPPTSGSHFAVWAKRGVYDRVISDGYLIHSLEHGYVIISYDCTKPITSHKLLVTSVLAHETEEPHEETEGTEEPDGSESGKPLMRSRIQPSGSMSWFTPENPPEDEVGLPNEFSSDECRDLVTKLSKFLDDYDRLVVVPRPDMNTLISLTAWRKIEKLKKFDGGAIKEFTSAYHNQGPEKTVE